MSKIYFINSEEAWEDNPAEKTIISLDGEQRLPVIIETFERFLRASGYHFKGSLELVKDD